jgi:adenylate cyclase class 2
MVLIFNRLGFNADIIYQKYRQNFIIGNVSLSIDELPFGTYIEIEGAKEEIDFLIEKLELETTEISAMGYLELYYKYCEEQHIQATGKITFTNKEQ